jgi:hypothetical protein
MEKEQPVSQEHNHQLMQEGEQAVAIRGLIEEFVQDRVRNEVVAMIAMYRNGDTHHDKLVGKVAEIAALESLLSDLNTIQQRGIVARNKEIRNATP